MTDARSTSPPFASLRATLANPILLKCARARMRPKHLVSWGTVTLTVTTFICLFVYLATRQRVGFDPAHAARTMLIPLAVLQSVIIMLLGTGAVASRLSFERDSGLLDYYRMTPMSPTGKIVGFLFGLPVREYALFGITVPFTIWAAIRGEFPISQLVAFYVVFFSSALLYHLTGMVAGMASSHPRRAAMFAQALVVLLYVFLPQLSRVGFTFFEFLTIVPTARRILAEEFEGTRAALDETAPFIAAAYGDVPFFGAAIDPVVFTLLVQGFLLAILYSVVRRKWIDQEAHPLSKLGGTLLHAGGLTLLVGSLWPIVTDQRFYGLLSRLFTVDSEQFRNPRNFQGGLFLLLFIYALLCGVVTLFVVQVVTPSRDTARKALRRARKLGLRRVPWNADGASGLPATLATILLTWIGWAILLEAARRTGRFFEGYPPAWIALGPPLHHAAVSLFAQGLRERFGGRVYFVGLFLFWMIPAFAALVLAAAELPAPMVVYVALPFPPVGGFILLARFFGDVVPLVGPDGPWALDLLAAEPTLAPHRAAFAFGALVPYLLLAAAAQAASVVHRRHLAARVAAEPIQNVSAGGEEATSSRTHPEDFDAPPA